MNIIEIINNNSMTKEEIIKYYEYFKDLGLTDEEIISFLSYPKRIKK